MPSLSESAIAALRAAHREVLDRIAAAAHRKGRDPKDITLVAVTKTAAIEQIAALLAMGQLDLGENRVQQLQDRARIGFHIADDPSPVIPRWHMIGHLQRNKVKFVVPLVCLIHSVDSLRLAEEINAFGMKRAAEGPNTAPIDVLLQVNIAEEEQKFGLGIADAPALAEQVAAMKHVRLRGLMTMAPYGENGEESRPVFAQAAELFHTLKAAVANPSPFNLLSMGMTNDFEVAIEEGANVVRVGRALFGE